MEKNTTKETMGEYIKIFEEMIQHHMPIHKIAKSNLNIWLSIYMYVLCMFLHTPVITVYEVHASTGLRGYRYKKKKKEKTFVDIT